MSAVLHLAILFVAVTLGIAVALSGPNEPSTPTTILFLGLLAVWMVLRRKAAATLDPNPSPPPLRKKNR